MVKTPSPKPLVVDDLPRHDCLVLSFVEKDLRSPLLIYVLEKELDALAKDLKRSHAIIDFSGVTVAPTAILGLVLKFVVDAQQANVSVRVCALARSIRKAFDLLNGKGLVAVMDTPHEALHTPWKKKGWWPFSR